MNRSSFKPLENPYQPMVSQSTIPPDVKVRSENSYWIVGMMAFAMLPAVLGFYRLMELKIAAASGHPVRRCGCGLSPEYEAWNLIFSDAPVFAIFGGILGTLAANLWPKPQDCNRSLDR